MTIIPCSAWTQTINRVDYKPRNTVNNLKEILDALIQGKVVKFHDVTGYPRNSVVQGIRKEGGKDMWLITIQGIEVCAKAA